MIEVELVQFVGRSRGLLKTLPLDRVVVIKSSGERVSVGWLDQKPNAVLRFHRYLPDPNMREEIRRHVAALRHAQFGWSIAGFSVSPVDPRRVKAYLSGEKEQTKKKSTIWVPESMANDDA